MERRGPALLQYPPRKSLEKASSPSSGRTAYMRLSKLSQPSAKEDGFPRPIQSRASSRRTAPLMASISRTQGRCPPRQRPSPSKFRLGDFGPSFAEHLKSSKTAFVECLQIRRIAVIKLLKDIVHHLNPHNDPDRNWRRRRAMSNHIVPVSVS